MAMLFSELFKLLGDSVIEARNFVARRSRRTSLMPSINLSERSVKFCLAPNFILTLFVQLYQLLVVGGRLCICYEVGDAAVLLQ
jgi:hypothetical protein